MLAVVVKHVDIGSSFSCW